MIEKKSLKIRAGFIAALLIAVLSVLVFWVVSDVATLVHRGEFRALRFHLNPLPLTRPNLTPDQIQGWMTFRYINYVFHLPANYLPQKLNITDPSYPNISINGYVNRYKLSNPKVLKIIIELVKSFKSTPVKSSTTK